MPELMALITALIIWPPDVQELYRHSNQGDSPRCRNRHGADSAGPDSFAQRIWPVSRLRHRRPRRLVLKRPATSRSSA